MNGCDRHWLDAHAALPELHARKSATYGTDADRFANFTAVAVVAGEVPELYALDRMIEKLVRCRNMIKAGLADEVREYLDIASLSLTCRAFQSKRALPADLLPLDEPRAA